MTAQTLPRRSAYLSCALRPACAEIHFGGDARVAQGGDEALVVGHMVAVEHGDDDRAGLGGLGDDRALDRLAAPPAAARRRSRSRSREPARRESARPARRSARRRRPSRSGSACRPRPASRRSTRPRRPGRCNIRGRGRRRDRVECGRDIRHVRHAANRLAQRFAFRQFANATRSRNHLTTASFDRCPVLEIVAERLLDRSPSMPAR